MSSTNSNTMESVDSQLHNFNALLFDSLEFQMLIHTNRGFWEETGQISSDCQNGIEGAVDFGFDQMFMRYKYCRPVLDLLESWHDQLHNILWISMDVPYPQNLDQHVEKVLANCRRLFYNNFWERFEREMIIEVSRIQIIQRNWKEAWYNPSFRICKKRIGRECDEFNRILEELRESRRV